MKKISVIVPVYNGEKYIKKCLDSILNQTYKNFEIIVVNDGSKDNTLNILNEYTDRITIIDKENGGVASAKNKGLEIASGDYITFVDCDDWLEKDCFFDCLEKSQNADIIRFKLNYSYLDGTNYLEPDDFPTELLIRKEQFRHFIFNKMLVGIQLNSACRTLFKKKCLNDITFRCDLETGEDLVFMIETLSKAKTFIYINKGYYNYFQTNEGLTGKGLPIKEKYKCNLIISHIMAKKLKQWKMATITNYFLCYFRVITITILKIIRSKKL